jgi:hypothetical protein
VYWRNSIDLQGRQARAVALRPAIAVKFDDVQIFFVTLEFSIKRPLVSSAKRCKLSFMASDPQICSRSGDHAVSGSKCKDASTTLREEAGTIFANPVLLVVIGD